MLLFPVFAFFHQVSEVDIENLTCEPPNILSEDQFLETNNENFFMEVSHFFY